MAVFGLFFHYCVLNLQAQMEDSMRYCSTEEPVVGGGGVRALVEASKSKNLRNIA